MRTIVHDTDVVEVIPRVRIKDGNGAWQDVTDRVYSISYSDSIDYDSPTVDIDFRNAYQKYVAGENRSLDPEDRNSVFFVNDEPLLGAKHEVTVEISKDQGAHFYEIFRGYVGPGSVKSSVKVSGDDTVSASMVGLDYNLKSYYFTDDLVYEDAFATSIANQILADHGFSQTVRVIDDPN